jgi:hypothetical protein
MRRGFLLSKTKEMSMAKGTKKKGKGGKKGC